MIKEKSILLITPPFYRLYKKSYSLNRYPLSLGYLSATIKQRTSWKVVAYNADFQPNSERIEVRYLADKGFKNYLGNLNDTRAEIWQELKQKIQLLKPSVVGISCMTQTFKSATRVAKIVKEIDHSTLVIMGGPHPSMVRTEVLQDPDIDICVFGEGEETIVEILDAIETNRTFDHIKGIAYRLNGEIIETPERELIVDLDTLPFPSSDASKILLDYDRYPPEAFQHIFAIRGCPFNCIFCGSHKIWGRRPRYRTIHNIVTEMRSLQDKGIKLVRFEDDTFGVKVSFITDLCQKIKTECPGLQWSCEMHVNNVSNDVIKAMKAAGCGEIVLGIESGNNEMLKKINKHITIEDSLIAAKMIKKQKIKLGAYFMVGYPWETEDSLADTLYAMKKIKADYNVYSIFTPYKGTKGYDICYEMNLIKEDFDYSIFNHQSPLNHFSNYISHDRFRELTAEIERISDKKGLLPLLNELFSLDTYSKISGLSYKKILEEAWRRIKPT